MKNDWSKKTCFALLPLVLALAGCCHIFCSGDNVPYRVITQVDVAYQNGEFQAQRHYYQEGSIHAILEYLRHVDPYGVPKEEPQSVTGREYLITIVYSDGSQHLYEQHADQYLRIDNANWKRIDPQKALILSGLFSMMPSEEPPNSTTPIPSLIKPQI